MVKQLESLAHDFADNVAAQTVAIHSGDARRGAEYGRRYVKAFQKLLDYGDEGRAALASFFADPREDVRVMAAAFLLRYRTDEALTILRTASMGRGLSALGATETLKRWADGTWALDPEESGS